MMRNNLRSMTKSLSFDSLDQRIAPASMNVVPVDTSAPADTSSPSDIYITPSVRMYGNPAAGSSSTH